MVGEGGPIRTIGVAGESGVGGEGERVGGGCEREERELVEVEGMDAEARCVKAPSRGEGMPVYA